MAAVAELPCPTCALEVPHGFTFCPRCRAEAQGRPYDAGEIDRHERTYVLTLVLLTLGALGVPRLWKSSAFGVPAKIVLSVLGFAQTALSFYVAYWFLTDLLPSMIQEQMGGVR